jgi:uracil-DNA glycosylase
VHVAPETLQLCNYATVQLISAIVRFVDALSRVELSDRACNQYARGPAANAIRRRNLRCYLEAMQVIGPRLLLVGEAVSYRGGRLTGIAFTSESLMLCDGIPGDGYRQATESSKLSTEASATMVWATIRTIEPLPLLWNAFPFHPFARGNPHSNRMPANAELAIGERFIDWLLRLFPIEQVVAVGNQADASLTRMGIEHVKVRHPSQGGKRKFVEGITSLRIPN